MKKKNDISIKAVSKKKKKKIKVGHFTSLYAKINFWWNQKVNEKKKSYILETIEENMENF